MPYTPHRCDPTTDSMPADPGVRLIIDYADTADIGMSSAPSANRRRVYHDRAVVVTVAIMQIFETAPTPERRAALEAYLRDELADVPAPQR